MIVTERVALEVAYHEAIVRQTYKDSVGINTWSVGITNAVRLVNVDTYIGKPQPMQKCIDVYLQVLERKAEDVRRAFQPVHLNEAQFAAALSFHYNTGSIGRATWVKSFVRGDHHAAEREIMNWLRPVEITKRRTAERELFFRGKWSNNGTILEYTRVTSRMTPVWSSAERRDIRKELANAMKTRVGSQRYTPKAQVTSTKTSTTSIKGRITAFLNRFKT